MYARVSVDSLGFHKANIGPPITTKTFRDSLCTFDPSSASPKWCLDVPRCLAENANVRWDRVALPYNVRFEAGGS